MASSKASYTVHATFENDQVQSKSIDTLGSFRLIPPCHSVQTSMFCAPKHSAEGPAPATALRLPWPSCSASFCLSCSRVRTRTAACFSCSAAAICVLRLAVLLLAHVCTATRSVPGILVASAKMAGIGTPECFVSQCFSALYDQRQYASGFGGHIGQQGT